MKTPFKVDKDGYIHFSTKTLIFCFIAFLLISSVFYYKKSVFDQEMQIKVKKMEEEARKKKESQQR